MSATVAGLVGGGGIAKVLLAAQRDSLRKSGDFATREELNGFGRRLDAAAADAERALENSRANGEALIELNAVVHERLLRTLDDMREESRTFFERQTDRDDTIHDTLVLHAIALRATLKRQGVDDAELPPIPKRRTPRGD